MSAADGPALVAAAIRASIQSKAPRRTVAAVAAAVASVFRRPLAARATPPTGPVEMPTDTQRAPGAGHDDSPEELLTALRTARRAQRRRKKARRRVARAGTGANAEDPPQTSALACPREQQTESASGAPAASDGEHLHLALTSGGGSGLGATPALLPADAPTTDQPPRAMESGTLQQVRFNESAQRRQGEASRSPRGSLHTQESAGSWHTRSSFGAASDVDDRGPPSADCVSVRSTQEDDSKRQRTVGQPAAPSARPPGRRKPPGSR